MANTFKSNKSRLVGTSEVSVYSVGNTSGYKTIVIGCSLANRLTNSVTASVSVYDSGNDQYYVVKDAPVPAGGALEVMAEVRVIASESNAVDVLLSIMEIT